LEYRQDAAHSGMCDKDMDYLLEFQLCIANSHVHANNPAQPSRKCGRPSSLELIPRDATVAKHSAKEICANSDILTNGIVHMPEYDNKKRQQGASCSYVPSKHILYCDKWNVHYCFFQAEIPSRWSTGSDKCDRAQLVV